MLCYLMDQCKFVLHMGRLKMRSLLHNAEIKFDYGCEASKKKTFFLVLSYAHQSDWSTVLQLSRLKSEF